MNLNKTVRNHGVVTKTEKGFFENASKETRVKTIFPHKLV